MMKKDSRQRDIHVFSQARDFGKDTKLAVGIVDELRVIYREKAQAIMSRFSRGSVLIQDGKVLTNEMIEERFRGWR